MKLFTYLSPETRNSVGSFQFLFHRSDTFQKIYKSPITSQSRQPLRYKTRKLFSNFFVVIVFFFFLLLRHHLWILLSKSRKLIRYRQYLKGKLGMNVAGRLFYQCFRHRKARSLARYVECQEFIYLFELPAADDRYRVIVAYLQQHRY